jgi:hypothetical protein
MQVSFIYPKGEQHTAKEHVTIRICELAALHIDLPDQIVVEFQRMGPSVYGSAILNPAINNRFCVNLDLSIHEIIYPIVHELIHISQMHRGQLAISRSGVFVWEGKTYKIDQAKLTYAQYQNLPWEKDVTDRFKVLLEKILK